MDGESNLGILLADGDSLEPVGTKALDERAPGPESRAPRPPKGKDPEHLFNLGAAANDLPEQRWGVVVPKRGGDALLRWIAPLVERRAADQGITVEKVKTYRVDPDMSHEDSVRWIQDRLAPDGRERPRYLLLLGDFDQVSLELQQALAVEYFPGRLALPTQKDYEAYVEKVLRWEDPSRASVRSRVVAITARTTQGRDVPDDGYQKLMMPACDRIERRRASGSCPFEIEQPLPGAPVPLKGVLSVAQSTSVPTVLWTMTHGIGKTGTYETKRQLQGALLFGEAGDSERLLTADKVATGPFLPGGFWFMFACFGGGTPSRSVYWHWLDSLTNAGAKKLYGYDPDDALRYLPAAGDKAFVAALPKAALANPDWPLAVLGHVDLAWIYAYGDIRGTGADAVNRFLEVPTHLLDARTKNRAAVAMWAFTSNLAQIDQTLVDLDDKEQAARARGQPSRIDPAQRGRLWMLRQDLAAYVLLGDPAVRLPIKEPPLPDPYAALGMPRPPDPPLWPDTPVMEDAVIDVLGGRTREEIAKGARVAPGDLERWVRAYREAGMKALDNLRRGRG